MTLASKMHKLVLDGPSQLAIISDFDKTITCAFAAGKKHQSSYAILRSYGYLPKEYEDKAHALHMKYYPIEISAMPITEKIPFMEEWWRKHHELLLEYGVRKSYFVRIAQEKHVKVRDGAFDFFKRLRVHNIPLLIFSAGLGDVIKEQLVHNKLLTPNVHIISNFFDFENDVAIRSQEPLIHVFNKKEIAVEHMPFFKDISSKKNAILLGDSLGDLGMVEGFNFEEVLKIGFLNEKISERLEEYQRYFDLVILHDGDFSEVNKLLEQILSKSNSETI